MVDIIFTASILAAFLAGAVALFAPCCITVLLPAYLASVFRERKNILKMTFVFFAGISLILVPIGLGAAWLAQFFRDFHKEMYIFGGVLMIILSVLAVAGRGLTMVPLPKRLKLNSGLSDSKSVFLLGIFSGAATSCCAPVLAGAVTLAVISGAFWKALLVTFSYVFGMTFPLFVAAYFYDRFKIGRAGIIKGKIWKIGWGEKTFSLHSTNLIAAIVFLVMGIVLLVLAFSGNAFWAPSFQAKIGQALNAWSQKALELLSNIPDIVWGIIILGLFFLFFKRARRNPSKKNYDFNKSN